MKKTRLMSLVISIVLILSVMASCAKQKTAMEYEDCRITTNMYSYWLSQIKSGYVSSSNDTEDYWNTQYTDGGTYGEKLKEIVDFNVKVNLVCMSLFDELGLKITSEEKKEIDTAINDLLVSYGTKSELNSMLAEFGINVNILKDIYTIDLKASKVYEALYADGGSREIDDEELDKFYKENYSRIDIIFVYDSFEYKKDENGNLIFNQTTNTYEKTDLNDEQKANKKALADDIFKKVQSGEDFGELKKQYNEYPDGNKYELGYFISANDIGSYDSDIYLAVSQMEIGDVKKVEKDGAICIIKRNELTEKPYVDKNYTDMFKNIVDYCQEADFNAYMEEVVKGVTVYDEELAGFSVEKAPLMRY